MNNRHHRPPPPPPLNPHEHELLHRLDQKVDRIQRLLEILTRQGATMADELVNLQSAVAEIGNDIDAVLAALQAGNTDPAALLAMTTAIKEKHTAIQAALNPTPPVEPTARNR